ncbi:MAG: winged helix-turn-helix domain-containing protein [Candidatus ainarchaeum sp.]|nr:winged helix-turn-helix domain-containing protein [Candidatus ainarchaeum sp.]
MIEDLSFVLRGKIRTQIITSLTNQKNPQRIAKEINTHLSTTSRALTDLESKGLVKCLNPKDAFMRFYELTEKGKEIKAEIKKVI